MSKTARERMDVIAAYETVGTFRDAAQMCGTTHKTVKRIVEVHQAEQAGEPPVERAGRGHNYDAVADLVVLWWREDAGDLVDAPVDALTNLAEGGAVLLMTPKSGRDGHVEPSEISEAALSAGLHGTSSLSAGPDWSGTRLVAPKSGRR